MGHELLPQLAKHIERWDSCTDCSLHKSRTTPVLFEKVGNAENTIWFLGEAPGDSEDTCGRPFIGPTGRLLRQLIEECGISSYGLINTIACIPLAGTGRKLVREPTKAEITACRPRLLDFFSIEQPTHLVLAGKVAKAQKKYLPKVPILNIDHPSFMYRTGRQDSFSYRLARTRLTKFVGGDPTNGLLSCVEKIPLKKALSLNL